MSESTQENVESTFTWVLGAAAVTILVPSLFFAWIGFELAPVASVVTGVVGILGAAMLAVVVLARRRVQRATLKDGRPIAHLVQSLNMPSSQWGGEINGYRVRGVMFARRMRRRMLYGAESELAVLETASRPRFVATRHVRIDVGKPVVKGPVIVYSSAPEWASEVISRPGLMNALEYLLYSSTEGLGELSAVEASGGEIKFNLQRRNGSVTPAEAERMIDTLGEIATALERVPTPSEWTPAKDAPSFELDDDLQRVVNVLFALATAPLMFIGPIGCLTSLALGLIALA